MVAPADLIVVKTIVPIFITVKNSLTELLLPMASMS